MVSAISYLQRGGYNALYIRASTLQLVTRRNTGGHRASFSFGPSVRSDNVPAPGVPNGASRRGCGWDWSPPVGRGGFFSCRSGCVGKGYYNRWVPSSAFHLHGATPRPHRVKNVEPPHSTDVIISGRRAAGGRRGSPRCHYKEFGAVTSQCFLVGVAERKLSCFCEGMPSSFLSTLPHSDSQTKPVHSV